MSPGPRRPLGVTLLSIFFALGALACAGALLALVFPSRALDFVWRLNPEGGRALRSMGAWAIVLMAAVGASCALAAAGLRALAPWGRRLALVVLSINLVGDTVSAGMRHDLRTLIGLPVGGAMILYLLSNSVSAKFGSPPAGGRT